MADILTRRLRDLLPCRRLERQARALCGLPKGGRSRLAVRFTDASRPVWPLTTIGDAVAYLSVAEHEIDIYVMDLVQR